MKPLISIVVAIALVTVSALPENIEDVKQLPQSNEPALQAEESDPQARVERCTTCTNKLSLKSHKDALAAIQQLPGAEVHTQQSFEGCSSDQGCAGLKVKDGKIIEKFGNVDAFKAAAAQDTGNEFTFHAAGSLGLLEGGPFWWMNQNSPFKNGAAGGYEKFSKSSSSSFSTSGNGAANFDLAGNPFLNGDFSKLSGGFSGAGFTSQGAQEKPSFQSSSFESSSFSSSNKDVDISKNPFLNGGVKLGQAGFQNQAGFANAGNAAQFGQIGFGQGFNSQSQSSFNKFGTSGYTGSSPAPFSSGANVNLIQNTQKNSEFDFESQQTQQNVDEAFQSTGNVNAHEHSGGDLQQTCAGQGYVCVPKAKCNNGVVNSNGGNLLQANTQKQYCNVRTEICCRLEVSSLAGAGNVQGSLGVGSASFSGSGSQGSGLFVSNQNSQSGFSQSGQGQNEFAQSGQNGFSQSGQNGFSQSGQNGFNQQGSQSSFSQTGQSSQGSGFSQTSGQGTTGFGSTVSTNKGFNSQGFGSFGSEVNRGTIEGTTFENRNKFSGVGSTVAPTTNKFGSGFNNEVFKSTSQSNFIETDSFSAGSETLGSYRPGATGLKPGIPYLPPVDSSTAGSNAISSTAFVTTPRPTTPRPVSSPRPFSTPRPVTPSTSAPGYLPPVGESSNTRETRLPPSPTYNEGQIILDETRQPRPTPRPAQNEVPSGCAAALKCTPIEYCTAEGVISNTTVVLTREQDAYRVPLTDCKDLETGRIGKCCRDPLYTDPWPTNQLGRWVPGVFGGNDGKYVPDSRGSPSNNPRPQVTVRPPITPITGSVILNTFNSPKPTTPAFGPNQVTPGYPSSTPSSFTQKGQYEVRGQGSYNQGGQGQFGVAGLGQNTQGSQFGQGSQFSQSSFGQTTKGQGQIVSQGVGQTVTQGQGAFGQGGRGQYEIQGQAGQNQYTQTQNIGQGQGQIVSQGQGFGVIRGSGQTVTQGVGQQVTQGVGQGVIRGSGQVATGQGFAVSQGQGQTVSQGAGFGVSQGSGFGVTQGQGQAVSQGVGFGVNQGSGLNVIRGQGQAISQGQGIGVTRGQGQIVTSGQGIAVSQGAGQQVSQGSGFAVSQGSGTGILQGQGVGVTRGQGQFVSQGQGQIVSQGQGQAVSQGGGFGIVRGQGEAVSQGVGFGVSQGQGFGVSQGGGFGISQGSGQAVSQGSGFGISTGQGQRVDQGIGFGVNQGFGIGVIRGQGQKLTQGAGVGIENDYSETVQRVFLQRYNGGGQCGVLNPQKPYGNRNDLEVDFAEIPWQAMVLLQTNRSLLCGGVITRPDVVVTSAACVDGLDAKNVLIKGGEWKLGIDDEPLPFQIVQVKHILRHPFYRRGNLKYDAAILVLAENLRFSKNIYPICLPRAGETLDAYYNGAGECLVSGWGKIVLQAHLEGSIMHALNVSLINPGECEAKLSQDYPHLLEQYSEDSCVCGQPTNPANNICKVDIGSALACTSGDGHYVFRGVYSWDSGCQTGNQIAGFYKFDLEWYEWAIGLIESTKFAKFTTTSKSSFSSQLNSGIKSQVGIKGGITGVKGGSKDLNQFGQFSQFGKFDTLGEIKPVTNTFSATYTEKKVFQSEPKFVTYTTKPEIVTFTTKPEYFTYTTKPKIVTYTTKPEIVTYTTKPEIVTYTTKPKIVSYTTKPQIIKYETSGSGTNPQYVAPGITFNPNFSDVVGHKHSANCKCLEGRK